MIKCEDCKYATWDYEEYYGGKRQYFVDGCKKDLDNKNGTCEEAKREEEV